MGDGIFICMPYFSSNCSSSVNSADVALGMIPGSVNVVLHKEAMTSRLRAALQNGKAIPIFS
ncbi:hypothetical protein T03_13882 [Trichinella britovi]|uniref:Uncharacterized protein n=1 Tax=Trichinella britovi TaxID=45882 RepID=A0A0V1CXD2_TRIBR|nr:hypothetical protein T03_13882 [Trichinella britovi]